MSKFGQLSNSMLTPIYARLIAKMVKIIIYPYTEQIDPCLYPANSFHLRRISPCTLNNDIMRQINKPPL